MGAKGVGLSADTLFIYVARCREAAVGCSRGGNSRRPSQTRVDDSFLLSGLSFSAVAATTCYTDQFRVVTIPRARARAHRPPVFFPTEVGARSQGRLFARTRGGERTGEEREAAVKYFGPRKAGRAYLEPSARACMILSPNSQILSRRRARSRPPSLSRCDGGSHRERGFSSGKRTDIYVSFF